MLQPSLLERQAQRLNAHEARVAEQISAGLRREVRALLQRSRSLIAEGNLRGLQQLQWAAAASLYPVVANALTGAFTAGQRDAIREIRAAIPETYANPASQLQQRVRDALELQPRPVANSKIAQANRQRALTLAGRYTTHVLEQAKGHLIAAIVPQADGKPISRRELVQRLEQTLQVNRARANAIARTETTRAYNQGRIDSFKVTPLVTHVRFNAINDTRISVDICLPRNGKVFTLAEAEAYHLPPLHVNCRSQLQPLLPEVSPRHREIVDNSANAYVPFQVPTPAPPVLQQSANAAIRLGLALDEADYAQQVQSAINTGATDQADPEVLRSFRSEVLLAIRAGFLPSRSVLKALGITPAEIQRMLES